VRVIDASALIKYLNREDGWRRVEEYILEGCITIDLALKEVANALWKRVKRGEVTERQALAIMEIILESKIVKIHSQQPLINEALKSSITNDLPIYDSLYIILAKHMKMPLVTSDKRQAEKAKMMGVNPILL